MNFFKTILLVSFCIMSSYGKAQKVEVGTMKIIWKFENDHIFFEATAPDDGWIALGFNSKNDIVGSNLIMVNVNDTETTAEDFYVVSAGNPQPVEKLRSASQIKSASGSEDENGTTVRFSLPIESADDYHHNFYPGKEIWLICAFSMEDNFEHHSRFRKHVKITL